MFCYYANPYPKNKRKFEAKRFTYFTECSLNLQHKKYNKLDVKKSTQSICSNCVGWDV